MADVPGRSDLIITKGAFTTILSVCTQIMESDAVIALDIGGRERLERRFREYGSSGVRVSEALFQTSWFIVSMLTELAVLFLLGTCLPVWRSKPGGLF